MKRPPLIADRALLLPPRLLGDVDYYRLAARFKYVAVDGDIRYNKRQKEIHRCVIADTHGILRLTVPVAKVVNPLSARWSDVAVSPHNEWWTAMWTSIESAYGRTPFFEFYADLFAPFFTTQYLGGCKSIISLDDALHSTICNILNLSAPMSVDEVTDSGLPVVDYRRDPLHQLPPAKPYYQVRAERLGFISSLSIIDLIFNIGPEAQIYLADGSIFLP